MYMEIASVVAKRSKDPKTKVGAVLVKDNRILGIGYNAEPKGFNYNFDWNSKEKHKYVIHAELNAIANATYFGNSIEGSTMFLTLSPCAECVKLLIQYGIKKVIYKEKYEHSELAFEIAEYSNLKLIQYKNDLMKENKQLNKVKLNDTTTSLTSIEITPEVVAQVRKIRLESARNNPRTVNFKSDKKPSFPGYKSNYMI